MPRTTSPFRHGDKVRFLNNPLTRQMGIVGKYGDVLVGQASTLAVKVLTPTRAGLMPWWFPRTALKLCTPLDPRPSEGSIIVFTECEENERLSLMGQIGIVIHNLPQSAYSHVETADYPDHCAHFSEIERIDL